MEVKKPANVQATDDQNDENDLPEIGEEKKLMMKKIDDILSQYYLNGVQKFAAQNFI
jgi:flagellin-like hook-associated protein FlgL